jgi:benzoyl-CoA-dihydrodiol lyase
MTVTDAATEQPAGTSPPVADFAITPDRYRHWRVAYDGPVATVTLAVDEHGGIVPGYDLKMNSYDLGVDIELYDIVQRLRFVHPGVRAFLV